MGRAYAAGIKKQTDNRFLNMYEIDAVQRDGTHFPYYMATRREPGDLMYETGQLRADGVVIYPVYRPDAERLVILRQFRYPANDYVYEVPAGLIDQGEEPIDAAVRELREETGLTFIPYEDYDMSLMRPFIQNQGMSDECNVTVFGYADGELSADKLEAQEDIQVILAGKEELRRILREELVSVRAAYLIMAFLRSDSENPFAFLHI